MITPDDPGFIKGFDWGLYPEAEKFLQKEIARFLRHNALANTLAKKMETETSTWLFDWVDHMVLPEGRVSSQDLEKLGFQETSDGVFRHTKTVFFPVLFGKTTELVIKPEDIEPFARKFGGQIEGERFAPYRKAVINNKSGFILSANERRGSNGFAVEKAKDIGRYRKAFETFKSRERKFSSDKDGMKAVKKLIRKQGLSKARAADAFFRNERAYWEKRNKAGQLQKKRQDALGLGWGNHDHHTYRSSRDNFAGLVEIFVDMGSLCRERFFAGEAAGWGAQILEHPLCDIVVFADVDITKEEKDMDFAHKGLKNMSRLGTVGMWIGLHGESILQAGMHHLEARFNFKRLCSDLPKHGKNVMKPFSDFPFLKQAFTQGEIWKVEKSRLTNLLKAGSITKEQHDIFLADGALGSHMENLQRRQGFKGFNQDSVTAIIKATDPRKYDVHRHA